MIEAAQYDLFQDVQGVLVPSAFSVTAAREARDEAVQRVEDNADEEWKRAALEQVRAVAQRQQTLTVDDVQARMQILDVTTHEGRAMGAVMLEARRRGWIESTGRTTQSKQKQCHAGPRTVWRSLLLAPF